MSKKYDLILYGATGFVGQQAIAYLAEHAAPSTRWAIAGRSKAKLQSVLEQVAHERPGAKDISIVAADAQDETALDALAAQANVVLSCAGPFALYGSKLVAACVKHHTHYCDITGETPWVRQMIDAHHAAAQASNTRIVPGCGFDSVPSDLGAYLLMREMRKRFDAPCTEIKAAFTVSSGGFNGGTLASVMNMIAAGQRKALADPFLLNPEGTRPTDAASHADPMGTHWDDDFQAWLGLFVMGPVNTRVVRRSFALRSEQVRYQEYLRFGRSAAAAVVAGGFGIGSQIGMRMLTLAPLRKAVEKVIPQPGEGPSAARMARSFFKIELIGTFAQSSSQGKRLRATIGDHLDAANGATAKMMCEAALAMAEDEASLPKAAGVITPSVALGDVLEKRLLKAGMRVAVTDA
jgi:short subunit dehydrogenase-like uncharacterized protein